MGPVETITWERFDQLARQLAELAAPFDPQIILGVIRGGLFPATLLSFVLRRELYPIRLTSKQAGGTVTWLVEPPAKVRGRRVLVVHELAESGRTLALATARVRALGASQVRSAALYAHTWADPRPDFVTLTTDAMILSPWDREVYADGAWVTHPELSAALHDVPKPASEVSPPPGL